MDADLIAEFPFDVGRGGGLERVARFEAHHGLLSIGRENLLLSVPLEVTGRFQGYFEVLRDDLYQHSQETTGPAGDLPLEEWWESGNALQMFFVSSYVRNPSPWALASGDLQSVVFEDSDVRVYTVEGANPTALQLAYRGAEERVASGDQTWPPPSLDELRDDDG